MQYNFWKITWTEKQIDGQSDFYRFQHFISINANCDIKKSKVYIRIQKKKIIYSQSHGNWWNYYLVQVKKNSKLVHICMNLSEVPWFKNVKFKLYKNQKGAYTNRYKLIKKVSRKLIEDFQVIEQIQDPPSPYYE